MLMKKNQLDIKLRLMLKMYQIIIKNKDKEILKDRQEGVKEKTAKMKEEEEDKEDLELDSEVKEEEDQILKDLKAEII